MRQSCWRLPRPPSRAPIAGRNSEMILRRRPAPQHHGAVPPLRGQGTWAWLVKWMSI
jgi:hypothetical protein